MAHLESGIEFYLSIVLFCVVGRFEVRNMPSATYFTYTKSCPHILKMGTMPDSMTYEVDISTQQRGLIDSGQKHEKGRW